MWVQTGGSVMQTCLGGKAAPAHKVIIRHLCDSEVQRLVLGLVFFSFLRFKWACIRYNYILQI